MDKTMSVSPPKTTRHVSAPPDVNLKQLTSKRSPASYDDLLPASYRTSDDDVEAPTATASFLRKELGAERLNRIHQWLWLVGRPMPPRPLHYQRVVGRDIIVIEQMDLHLVWDEERVFLKPIPRYLLNQDFWKDFLTCKDRCASLALGYQRDESAFYDDKDTHQVGQVICEPCKLRRLANGFLGTYASLVSHENDLRIAKTSNLVPMEISWSQWRELVREWLAPEKKYDINIRYEYGELRLSRLNMIYRFTFLSPLRGYLYEYRTYHHFWNANLARIAAGFAYVIIVLTAMQVGLAADLLSKNNTFQRASYGFTIFSIVAPLIFLGILAIVFVGAFTFNLMATMDYKKRRFAVFEKRKSTIHTP